MKIYAFNQGMLRPWLPLKILLIMKVVIIILTTCLLQVSAATFGQRVTLSETDVPLELVLKKIQEQTGYDMLYMDKLLLKAKKVTISLTNSPLEAAMDKILKDQDLTYTITDQTIIIKEKAPTFLDRLANHWAAIDVRGRVVDQEGKPLPGATVKIKSTGKSVSTNAKGEFYIEKVDEGEVLVISFIGYVSKEVSAMKEMGNVVLELSDSKLDEVQVIAYGTTTRRLSTGNISSITAKDIEKQPVTNPLLALSGRVPGVFIEQGTGMPGTSVKVRIQGTNSMINGTEPLYVIDGVPFTSTLLPGISVGANMETSVGANGSPLNYINPADIERIDVLKDADATSIYGSRAANGAILITTKKGKEGITTVDFNLQSGIGQMTRRMQLLNTQEYIEMRKEAASNDNFDYTRPPFNSPSGPYRDLLSWDQNRYTDWQKELLGGTARYNNYSTTISGGNSGITYLFGATYHKETTIFERNSANSSGSVHFNLSNSSENQRFRMQFSGNYQININNLAGADLTRDALKLAPNAPALYNEDGSLNWAQATNGISTWENPLAPMLSRYRNKTGNLISNAVLSYQMFPGFTLKSSFGYTNLQVDELKIGPISIYAPESRTYVNGSSSFGNSNLSSWLIEPQLVYKRMTGKHTFDALAGATLQQNRSIGQRLRGEGFNSDQQLEDIRSATTVRIDGTVNTIYRYTAFYGRLNYIFDDKYVLNFNIRNDGSSRFGSANHFHTFGSGSAAWLFSNEALVKSVLPFLNFGKLRASYGTTGNDQIGDYQYLSLYSTINLPRAYQGKSWIVPTFLSNPYLQWEETKKLSLGMDLGFFGERILFTLNYNRNRSSNQLLSYPLPIITGFSGVSANFPATVQNTGWEFLLNTVNLRSRDFSWSSNVNLTIPRNKLAAFPGLSASSYASRYVIGESINIDKRFEWIGVDPLTGLYQYKTAQGGLTSGPNYSTDQIVILNPDPKFYGGLQNNISYKGFNLDVFISFTKQTGPNSQNGNMPGAGVLNQPIAVLKRWQKPGDATNVQKYVTYNGPNWLPGASFISSDGKWGDASYIRVKNVSLSWQLPDGWKRMAYLKNCRIYIQGQNLFTITNYVGLDPENRGTALPPLQVITAGLQVKL